MSLYDKDWCARPETCVQAYIKNKFDKDNNRERRLVGIAHVMEQGKYYEPIHKPYKSD